MKTEGWEYIIKATIWVTVVAAMIATAKEIF